MTDLEITRACARAMGYVGLKPLRELCPWMEASCALYDPSSLEDGQPTFVFDPLHDDAQAMALVKKFHLQINIWNELSTARGLLEAGWWRVDSQSQNVTARHGDLNRAICECVAKMKAGK